MTDPTPEPTRPQRITTHRFYQVLLDMGIVRAGDYPRRVVIDAEVGNVVRVYVERFGDERMLTVALALDGVQVEGAPNPQAADQKHRVQALVAAGVTPMRAAEYVQDNMDAELLRGIRDGTRHTDGTWTALDRQREPAGP